MAALTKDVQIQHVGTPAMIWSTASAADTFYAGAIVFADVALGLCKATAIATDRVLGICAENTVTAIGDKVPIYVDGTFLISYSSPAATDVGTFLVVDVDVAIFDNPANLVGSPTLAADDMAVGVILAIEGTAGWVRLWTGPIWSATLGWL